MTSVEDLERLIKAAYESPAAEATLLLNRWVQSSDARMVVQSLMDLLRHTQTEAVTFFALTTLQRLDLTLKERVELRETLLLWNSPSSLGTTYMDTKVGVVLSTLILVDFPSQWPNAFDELSTKTRPTMYLRTLTTVLEELQTVDATTTRIKDTMRGYGDEGPIIPPEQSVTAKIIETVVQLGTSDEKLSVLALQVLKGLIGWADVTLIVQESVLSWLVQRLSTISVAVECLEELVGRGMDVSRKVALLQSTQLLRRIHERVDLQTVDVSPIEVVIEVAKFINTTGLELVPSLASLPDGAAMQGEILNLFFRCFAYDDIDVSGAVIPLAQTVAQTLHDKPEYEIIVPQLLTVLFRQSRYPADFQFDYEDEDESEEEMYRAELRKLYQKIVRVQPDVCLQFVLQALANLPMPISGSPTPDVEAAVRLVYHYGEGIRPAPGLKVVMKNESFRSILIALHKSDITAHPHREVLLLYYDVVVRYAPVFKDQPDLLPTVLEAISGARGLQHSHARVRSRSCYLLLRLVKALEGTLKPFIETAVTGIQGLLANPAQYPLRDDDQLYLFETIGVLLGKTGLSPAEQQMSLTSVMTPHIQSIREKLQSPSLSQDPTTMGPLLAGSVSAITYLSKGFSKQCPPEVQTVLEEALSTTLVVLERLPSQDIVRRNSVILFQRMTQCLGTRVLQHAPALLHLLVDHCAAEDIQDVAQFFNQLCMKFREQAASAIDSALLPFLHKCRSLVPNASDVVVTPTNGGVPPHLQSEQLGIQKLTFIVLQHIATHRATAVLLSEANVGNLQVILQTMSEGAIMVEEPVVKKTCIQFFSELTNQWGGQVNGDAASPYASYLRFVLEAFVPGVLQSLSAFGATVASDAHRARCVGELGQVLWYLKTLREKEYNDYVLSGTLRATGCPADLLEAFRVAPNSKAIGRCLRALLSGTA